MIKRGIRELVLVIILILLGFSNVNAQSASVSAGNTNMAVGESKNISVIISGITGYFELISQDSSKLSVNTGAQWVEENATLNFNVTAKAVGNVSLTVKPNSASTTGKTPTKYEKSTSFNINISKPTPTVSSNANLSNLGIKPLSYDFHNFSSSSSNTKYYTTVPNNVTSVTPYVTVQDPKAKYAIGGNYNNLQVGTNNITVTVTAEAGNKKTYTIGVTRKSPEIIEPTVPNVIEKEEEKVLPFGISTLGFEKTID